MGSVAPSSGCGDGASLQIRPAARPQRHASLLLRRHQERGARPRARRHQQGARLRLPAMGRRILQGRQGARTRGPAPYFLSLRRTVLGIFTSGLFSAYLVLEGADGSRLSDFLLFMSNVLMV